MWIIFEVNWLISVAFDFNTENFYINYTDSVSLDVYQPYAVADNSININIS